MEVKKVKSGNFKKQRKLSLGFFGIALLLAAVIWVVRVNLDDLKQLERNINEQSIPRSLLLRSMNSNITRIDRLIVAMFVEKEQLEITNQEFIKLQAKINFDNETLQDLFHTSEEKKLYEQFILNIEKYQEAIPVLLNAIKIGDITTAQNTHQTSYEFWIKANDAIESLRDLDNKNFTSIMSKSVKQARFSVWIMIIFSISILLLSLILSIFLTKLMTHQCLWFKVYSNQDRVYQGGSRNPKT